MSVRVVIADDQELVRTGFRVILDSESGIEVVGEVGDGKQAVEISHRLAPDVVLMDIRMPVLDGLEATRRVVTDPDAAPRVLILTTFDLDEYVYEALRSGASGFLLKDGPAEQLISAVRVVARGDALLAPRITRRLISEFASRPHSATRSERLKVLTERELEVLKLIARGLSNTEIAGELYVAETTVRTHVGRVLTKLGLRDRTQAVVLAYETGLIQPNAPHSH
jgi:DNA-binding NarL/FixJ family response regulator